MVRAFLALEFSGDVREKLHMVQETLRTCRARLTYVEPENIHITVKFLGDVDERRLPALLETVSTISFTPFPVAIGNVTVNNPKRPFTVWCTIGDSGRCRELNDIVEEQLAGLGFAKETRRFTPHATIARIKDFDPSLYSALDSLKAKGHGTCVISGLKLKKSTLTPQGPIYEDLLEVVW